ncbi:MAG: hypothetical protein RIF34_00945, partial [Candidatus Kapaibacterium sp.]
MKTPILLTISILIIFVIPFSVFSQGCSDAGLGSFNLSTLDTTTDDIKVTLGLSNTTGIGDEAVLINSTGFELGATYSDFWFIAKIPFTFTSGTLGQTNGLGDLSLLLSSKLYSADGFGLSLAGGVKLATNNADLLNEGDKSMPMVYQTSNGTNDVVLLLAANIDD